MKRVIVAGGGASGLMAAISAARNGASVTILEAMERPGKKLLLTGNGRCNLTHVDECPEDSCFGADYRFIQSVMGQMTPEMVREFFHRLGLLTVEKNGYVYPVTGQSSSVLAVLLAEVRRLKIRLKYSEKISSIEYKDQIWQVHTGSWRYEAEALILACGSKAAPKTGSDGSGYELARMAGHRIRPVRPALAPVSCQEKFVSQLSGVRCRAAVSLYQKVNLAKRSGTISGKRPQKASQMDVILIRKETGELQWTNYGVSGIMIFQLSRFIAGCEQPEKSMYLETDLLPDYTETELGQMMTGRAGELSDERVSVLLEGILHEKLVPVVLEKAGFTKKTCCRDLILESQDEAGSGKATEKQLQRLIRTIKHLKLTPTGTKSFDVCQVCSGGVDTSEVEPFTLRSKVQPELYFAGELLDVDGLCGGYNLQWAWASGYAAGRAAAGGEHDTYQ